eukprot:1159099-Pelagomonas_calceolata.AAC.8
MDLGSAGRCREAITRFDTMEHRPQEDYGTYKGFLICTLIQSMQVHTHNRQLYKMCAASLTMAPRSARRSRRCPAVVH